MLPYPAFALHSHPATPCAAVARVAVTLLRCDAGWHLTYLLDGDLARLQLPPASARPMQVDGLWRHTCFEAFVGRTDDGAYREYNFSPSGDWAAYAFRAERLRDDGAPPPPSVQRVVCAHAAGRLTLDAWLPADAITGNGTPIGLAAVVEARDGQLSYWALAHPRDVPDFHHRAGWTVQPAQSFCA